MEDNVGFVVLVIFIVIRLLIAFGIAYLVFFEVRKLRRGRTSKPEETKKDVNGKDVGSSSGSRE